MRAKTTAFTSSHCLNNLATKLRQLKKANITSKKMSMSTNTNVVNEVGKKGNAADDEVEVIRECLGHLLNDVGV